MSASRDKGTRFETAIVRYARDHGFPLADRRPLKGRLDEGDILLCPGVTVEAKAGRQAQQASYRQKIEWLQEAQAEARRAHADIGVLIVQARGVGLARMDLHEFWYVDTFAIPMPACVRLDDGLRRLRWTGWGDPL